MRKRVTIPSYPLRQNMYYLEIVQTRVKPKLNFICYTYNVQNKCTISASYVSSKLQDVNTESDIRSAEAILDFIERQSLAVDDANINHVIEYLCTSWFV